MKYKKTWNYCMAQGPTFNIKQQPMMEKNPKKNTHTHVTEPLCYTPETNVTFQINHNPRKLKKKTKRSHTYKKVDCYKV